MDITDVRIKLVNDNTDRLKAFCSITLDDEFVIRDIKLVEGTNGLFVAMPSRKLSSSCPECRHKNPLQAHYCNDCGAELPQQRMPTDDLGRMKLYRDIAHPITPDFRQTLQDRIAQAYELECEEVDEDALEECGFSAEDSAEDATEEETDVRSDAIDEDETDEPSEYSSLIANLNPGERSRQRGRTETRGGDHRQRQGSAQDAKGRGRRRKRPSQRSSGDRTEQVQGPKTATTEKVVGRRDAKSGKPAFSQKTGPKDEEVLPVGAGSVSNKLSSQKPTEQHRPVETTQEDPDAFGAGIL